MNWRDFWNGDTPIYVNDRHRILHYDHVARGIADLVEGSDWAVLDHGSGESLSADVTARRCARLYLYDGAPNVQGKLRARFERDPRISVLTNASLGEIPDHSLDMVVANSLLQYLTLSELEPLLEFWRRKLQPAGKLVLADVIPPGSDALSDIRALLTFAFHGGFLIAACAGLVATFFSDYRTLRTKFGLTRFSEEEMIALLNAHGFAGERVPNNLGHNQTRMMFVARPFA